MAGFGCWPVAVGVSSRILRARSAKTARPPLLPARDGCSGEQWFEELPVHRDDGQCVGDGAVPVAGVDEVLAEEFSSAVRGLCSDALAQPVQIDELIEETGWLVSGSIRPAMWGSTDGTGVIALPSTAVTAAGSACWVSVWTTSCAAWIMSSDGSFPPGSSQNKDVNAHLGGAPARHRIDDHRDCGQDGDTAYQPASTSPPRVPDSVTAAGDTTLAQRGEPANTPPHAPANPGDVGDDLALRSAQ